MLLHFSGFSPNIPKYNCLYVVLLRILQRNITNGRYMDTGTGTGIGIDTDSGTGTSGFIIGISSHD